MKSRLYLTLSVFFFRIAVVHTDCGCQDTIPNCIDYIDLCSNPAYQELMNEKCRKICNICDCVDAYADCPDWETTGFCEDPSFTNETKKEWCARTCGYCSSEQSRCNQCDNTCGDSNPNCPDWEAQGFCESTAYTNATKKAYCALTCGFCSVEETTCATSTATSATSSTPLPTTTPTTKRTTTTTTTTRTSTTTTTKIPPTTTITSTTTSATSSATPPTTYSCIYGFPWCSTSTSKRSPLPKSVDEIKADDLNEKADTKSSCIDRSVKCANWNESGFCASVTYTYAMKQIYCAKTCNLC